MAKRARSTKPDARKAICIDDDFFGHFVRDIRSTVVAYLDAPAVAAMLAGLNPVGRFLQASGYRALRQWTRDDYSRLTDLVWAVARLPNRVPEALSHVVASIPPKDMGSAHEALRYSLLTDPDAEQWVPFVCDAGCDLEFAILAADHSWTGRWIPEINDTDRNGDDRFEQQLLFRLQLLVPLRFPFSVPMLAKIADSIAVHNLSEAAPLLLSYLCTESIDVDRLLQELVSTECDKAIRLILDSKCTRLRCNGIALVHQALVNRHESTLGMLLLHAAIALTCDCDREHPQIVEHLVHVNCVSMTRLLLASPKSDAAFARARLRPILDERHADVMELLLADSRVQWESA